MKVKLLVLALCSLLASATVSAQSNDEPHSNKGWLKIYVNYNPHSFSYDEDELNDLLPKMKSSFTFGFANASSISSSMPLFLEYGLAFNHIYGSGEPLGIFAYTTKIMSFSLPVNLTYKYDVNKDFAITPYAGFKMRYNAFGKLKMSVDGEKETFDYFDKDEGDSKTFQMGYQVGVNLIFSNKFSVDFGYDGFITEFSKDTSLRAWSLGVGLHF